MMLHHLASVPLEPATAKAGIHAGNFLDQGNQSNQPGRFSPCVVGTSSHQISMTFKGASISRYKETSHVYLPEDPGAFRLPWVVGVVDSTIWGCYTIMHDNHDRTQFLHRAHPQSDARHLV